MRINNNFGVQTFFLGNKQKSEKTPAPKQGKIVELKTPASAYRAMYAPDCDKKITVRGVPLSGADKENFKKLFDEIYSEIKKKNSFEEEYYKAQMQDRPNVLEFPTPYEKRKQTIIEGLTGDYTESEFAMNALSTFSGEEKKELASGLLGIVQNQKQELDFSAKKRTEDLFALSKTKDGFDLTKMDLKKEILALVDALEYSYSRDDFLDEILEQSAKKDGSIDVEFAHMLCKFLKKSEYEVSTKHAADTMKHFAAKDPAHRKEIFDSMLNLSKGDYAFDDLNTDFEDLFSLCFDDGGFSPKKAEILEEISGKVNDWIEEGVEEDFDKYPSYVRFGKNIIEGFFDEMNETGKKPDAAEYIQKRTEKIAII